ncbi:MAG: hypothetical protein WBA44_02505 [Mesorhizobium sp.]
MKKPRKPADTGTGIPGPNVQDPKEEPNPFKAKDWRLFTFAWSGFALRLLLCIGAVFSAAQFLQTRSEKRVERTLDLVSLWEGDDFQAAQSALKRRLGELNRQSSSLVTPQTTPDQMDVIMASIGNQAMTDQGGVMPLADFQDQFDRVVYFLSRVSSCVKGNLCDRDVADEYFLDYASSFWRFFGDWIGKQRERGSPNLAAGIEAYVKAPR